VKKNGMWLQLDKNNESPTRGLNYMHSNVAPFAR
jgi:hypothetical protein